MADYTGQYNEFLNLMPGNAPSWMRNNAPMMLLKKYDIVWKPVMEEIFIRRPAPRMNGVPISVDTPFISPFTSSLGRVSHYKDRNSRVTEKVRAVGKEVFQAQLLKEPGPTIDPMDFPEYWIDGFLDAQNQMAITDSLDAMSRRIELDLLGYSKGLAGTIANFSNQSTSRLLSLDARVASPGLMTLKGKGWDESDANPMYDITKMNMFMNDMAGKDIKFGFIGPRTAWALDNSSVIEGLVKYHFDPTQSLIGQTIKGVTLRKVMGSSYKEESGADTSAIGYPGLGDYRPDTWDARNKVDMMRHTSTSGADDGDTYEYGLFASGVVGSLHTAKTRKDHVDTMTPFPHTWKDDELGYEYSSLEFGYCPEMNDFANIMVVDKLALVNDV